MNSKIPINNVKIRFESGFAHEYYNCQHSLRYMNAQNPRIASSLTKRQIKSRCRRKKANPKEDSKIKTFFNKKQRLLKNV